MATHAYRPMKPHIQRGKCVLTTHVDPLTYDNLNGLAKSRGMSMSAFVSEALEFALMELEEQGLAVLKRGK